MEYTDPNETLFGKEYCWDVAASPTITPQYTSENEEELSENIENTSRKIIKSLRTSTTKKQKSNFSYNV